MVETLPIEAKVKEKLKNLTPEDYIGEAVKLTEEGINKTKASG